MHAIHPNARTTPAVRAEIARSVEPTGVLARRFGVSTETIRKWRKRGPADCQDRSARPHKLPWKASEEERAIVCALRRSTGFPLDDLTFVVTHFLPHLNRDVVYRILKAEGLNRLPAQNRSRKPDGAFKEYGLGFVHVDVKHLPKLRDKEGVTRKRFLFVAIDRCSRWVHLAVKDDETTASAVAFLKEAVQAFPFQVTHILTDRGSCFTADGFEAVCREVKAQHRTTKPYTPKTNGMVERFNGRVQREVLGITIYSHADLETLLKGFNRAYNARRQRVLGGLSPDEAMRRRMEANPKLANKHYVPPADPCALPKALLVVQAAKEVSHPDTYLALRSAMFADLQPADAIEAIWARDIVDLCWELQRLARVRTDVLARGRGDVLRDILCQGLKYRSETYRRMVTLSARWSAGDPDALACVEALLARRGYDSTLLVTQVYHANLGRLEMLDRMTTRIEYRRSKLLREIDRRRRDFAQRARATIERFTPPRSRQAWPQDEGLGHTPSPVPASPTPGSTASSALRNEPPASESDTFDASAPPPPQDERLGNRSHLEPAPGRLENGSDVMLQDESLGGGCFPSPDLEEPRGSTPSPRPGFDEPRTPLASSHEPIPPAAPPRGTTVPHKPHASHPSPPEREGL